jgi:hypothetical protein
MRKSHAYSHTDADADSNRHGFINTYSNVDTNSDGYPCNDGNGYCDTHSNAKSDTNSETQSNAEVSSHFAAAPVAVQKGMGSDFNEI